MLQKKHSFEWELILSLLQDKSWKQISHYSPDILDQIEWAEHEVQFVGFQQDMS